MKFKSVFCIVVFLNFYGAAKAQQDTNDNELLIKESIPLAYAQQYVIHSKILNEDRKVNIFLPESFYEASAQRTYPVLILLEDEFFLWFQAL